MRNKFKFALFCIIVFISDSFVYAANPSVANLNNSTVNANVIAAGNLVSKHSHFSGNLTINSSNITFSDAQIKGSITIRSDKKPPVLELHCGTKIQGNVIFIRLAGVIKKSPDSVIKGKVINGTIEALPAEKQCA